MRRDLAVASDIEEVRAALVGALLEVFPELSPVRGDDAGALLAALAACGFEVRRIEQINGISPA